jgi:LL-diaminopimelate aminotransferase
MHARDFTPLPLSPSIFERLRARSASALAEGKRVFDLSLNCPTGALPAHVVRALEESLQPRPGSPQRSAQSRGIMELREAASQWYERRFTVHLDPRSEILVRCSELDALQLVMRTLLEPGELVVLPSLCSPDWVAAAQCARARIEFLPLSEEQGWLPRLESLDREMLSAAKLLCIGYPHDPTGAVCEISLLREVLALCRDHEVTLLSMIGWSEFALAEKHLPSSIFELPGAREGALEISTFSCSHRLWDLGPAILAGSATRIETLSNLASHLGTNPALLLQKAASAAYLGDDTFLAEQRESLRRRKNRLCAGLASMGWELRPSAATIFLWGRIPAQWGEDELKFQEEVFQRSGVLMVPGSAFGPSGKGFVRLSVCLDEAGIDACLSRLAESRVLEDG